MSWHRFLGIPDGKEPPPSWVEAQRTQRQIITCYMVAVWCLVIGTLGRDCTSARLRDELRACHALEQKGPKW